MHKSILLTIIVVITSYISIAQASLTIENNSKRTMTIKIMKGNNSVNDLYETIVINAYQEQTVTFYESGYYFTKSKAILNGKNPIYQKGQPFYVTNDASGYSVLTLTFSIKESNVPQISGKQISKAEFDKN
jgi:hypothetical protein